MGHGMAKSLRQKLPSDSILLVYDVNKVVLQDFVDAYGVHGNVCAVSSPRQIAERAVCCLIICVLQDNVPDSPRMSS